MKTKNKQTNKKFIALKLSTHALAPTLHSMLNLEEYDKKKNEKDQAFLAIAWLFFVDVLVKQLPTLFDSDSTEALPYPSIDPPALSQPMFRHNIKCAIKIDPSPREARDRASNDSTRRHRC